MKFWVIPAIILFCIAASTTFADSVTTLQPTSQTVAPDTVASQPTTAGTLEYPLSPERQAKLQSYARLVNIWRFVNFFVSVLVLALLGSACARRARDRCARTRQKSLIL